MLQSTLEVEETDGDVEISYEVENVGDEDVDLTFMSGQQFDIIVTKGGEQVWRWSEGRMFTQAIKEMAVAPGETLSYTGLWEDPDPGTYEITGRLTAQSETVEATTELSI